MKVIKRLTVRQKLGLIDKVTVVDVLVKEEKSLSLTSFVNGSCVSNDMGEQLQPETFKTSGSSIILTKIHSHTRSELIRFEQQNSKQVDFF